ncbi:HlyU family transcriptional regulator [Halomonas koreensis]|uniref:HlyU family transcriptional regulator n=1 Tax=Halomonas koreensis TaxID=245385 RepID=A0ABU1G0S4_9GAMM|nr:HlyU family transcriptional regulator [Halomonas koreensis]MDR5866029.1 HlyU family transcriptional regulator [Halomonas koreensis]
MLKKLLSGLFGQGETKPAEAPEGEPVAYKGYQIVPQAEDLGGQFRVSGWIRKPGGEGEAMREHRFERSDVVPGREACDALMVSKAERFIDEMGDALFDDR